jgi:hypothetical protein
MCSAWRVILFILLFLFFLLIFFILFFYFYFILKLFYSELLLRIFHFINVFSRFVFFWLCLFFSFWFIRQRRWQYWRAISAKVTTFRHNCSTKFKLKCWRSEGKWIWQMRRADNQTAICVTSTPK